MEQQSKPSDKQAAAEQPADGDEQVRQLYLFAAELAGAGQDQERIRQALREKGVAEEEAAAMAAQVWQMKKQAVRKAGMRNLILGGLWFVGGTLVTVLTYGAASREGGTYVVAWGAIVFGALQMLNGAWQLLKG